MKKSVNLFNDELWENTNQRENDIARIEIESIENLIETLEKKLPKKIRQR